jgi:hypothetical protein
MSIALSVGFIGWLVVMLTSSKKQKDTTIIAEGTTRQDLEETIRNGRKLTLSMRQASLRLLQVEVKQEVEDLCRIAESMFDMLRRILRICVSSSSLLRITSSLHIKLWSSIVNLPPQGPCRPMLLKHWSAPKNP